MMEKECLACRKSPLDKDTIGINKKLLGKDIKLLYCMDCLADYLGCSVEDLLDKIEDFKEEGCDLFK
jgi:biotin operon repressor